jgi:hypothetical protein
MKFTIDLEMSEEFRKKWGIKEEQTIIEKVYNRISNDLKKRFYALDLSYRRRYHPNFTADDYVNWIKKIDQKNPGLVSLEETKDGWTAKIEIKNIFYYIEIENLNHLLSFGRVLQDSLVCNKMVVIDWSLENPRLSGEYIE